MLYLGESGVRICNAVVALLCWSIIGSDTAYTDDSSMDTIILSAVEIPVLLEKNKTGPFVQFTKDLGKVAGVKFDLRILPGLRAKSMFDHGQSQASFPVFLNFPDRITTRPSVLSDKFMTLAWGIFSAPGSPPYQSLQDLYGKRVGLFLGYGYHPSIENDQNIIKIRNSDEKKNLILLMRGRLDAVIMFPHDYERMRRELKLPKFTHSKDVDAGSSDLGFVFPDTTSGRMLRDRVNRGLETMWQSDRLPLRLDVTPKDTLSHHKP